MKLAAPLLLLVSLSASAQPPQGAAADPQRFQQVRQKMLAMMGKSIPAMQRTRDCIQSSSDTESLNRCVDIMLAFQQEMRGMMGMPEGGPHGKMPTAADLKLQWSSQLQQSMLQDIDRTIDNSKTVRGCLQASNSGEAMQACMEQKGLAGRR